MSTIQEAFEDQGYLVITSMQQYKIGEVATKLAHHPNQPENLWFSAVVVGSATAKDFQDQVDKYWPDFKMPNDPDYKYYHKVIAE